MLLVCDFNFFRESEGRKMNIFGFNVYEMVVIMVSVAPLLF